MIRWYMLCKAFLRQQHSVVNLYSHVQCTDKANDIAGKSIPDRRRVPLPLRTLHLRKTTRANDLYKEKQLWEGHLQFTGCDGGYKPWTESHLGMSIMHEHINSCAQHAHPLYSTSAYHLHVTGIHFYLRPGSPDTKGNHINVFRSRT